MLLSLMLQPCEMEVIGASQPDVEMEVTGASQPDVAEPCASSSSAWDPSCLGNIGTWSIPMPLEEPSQ